VNLAYSLLQPTCGTVVHSNGSRKGSSINAAVLTLIAIAMLQHEELDTQLSKVAVAVSHCKATAIVNAITLAPCF